MTIRRYNRKPDPRREGGLCVARYEPGQPLDDLLAVARMACRRAEVAEAVLPSGPVLVVKWTSSSREDQEPEFDVVRGGLYLSYSEGYDSLVENDDADLRQWYEPAQ
jgi:hypothetical protein